MKLQYLARHIDSLRFVRLSRRVSCRAGVCAVAALLPMLFAPQVVVADETPAEKAAREIADARERVNELVDLIFDAELRIEELEASNDALAKEISEVQGQIGDLQRAVESIAADRFTDAGGGDIPVLTGFENPADAVQKETLVAVVNSSADAAFDELDSLIVEVEGKLAQLDRQKAEAEQARADLDTMRAQAEAEVARLKEVEAGRLQDDKVRAALQAELRERERQAESDLTRINATANSLAPAGNRVFSVSGGPTNTVQPIGETGGGRTGGGGIGGVSVFTGVVLDVGPGWFCPSGPHPTSFESTWGAPRSGGRSHQGVDMIMERGTPLYAVEDGVVVQKQNELGGLTVSLLGVSGTRYYYAHLDSYAATGAVTKGTVIGLNGDSGNAKFSTPHLHFEIHPGGGPAVDPYPTIRQFCPAQV